VSRGGCKAPRGYGNAPDGLGNLSVVEGRGAVLMGELVNLKEYRAWKAEQEAEKEMGEALKNLDEIEMLRNILDGIIKDLPNVDTSIMYVPIEPKMDAFMSKDLDGWLAGMDLQLGIGEDNDREDT
jgi:hypothetical protein